MSLSRRSSLCAVLALPAFARAQPLPRRVGWLGWSGDTVPDASLPLLAFRRSLAALGWKEGENLHVEVRQGEREAGPSLAGELLRAGVELIVAHGVMVFGARGHTGSTPVVFGINGDPVEAGLVSSLARPGGNHTGITALATELVGKRLELLKTAKPTLQRVAILANERHPGLGTESRAAQEAAARLGAQLRFFPVRASADFESALAAIKGLAAGEAVSGLMAFPDTLINRHAPLIGAFCVEQRLPSISGWADFAHAGNLLAYGPGYEEFFRQLARYADRILKGAKPADIPVELPTHFHFAMNLKAAAALKLSLPRELLLRADEVIR